MSGCMTHDPYTGEELVSKAIIGAAIGATVGAIGGGVGYYTDRQERSCDKNWRILVSRWFVMETT